MPQLRVLSAALALSLLAPALAIAQDAVEARDAVRAAIAEDLGLSFVTTIGPDQDIGLLAVDVQRSFTDPEEALYVPGSETDVAAIDGFVRANMGRVTHAWYTMDTHPRYYVGSKLYLKDQDGAPPPMFVDIDPNQMLDGTYVAANPHHQEDVEAYARCLLENGLSWNIWPDHGEQGATHWALHPTIEELFNAYAEHWASRTERAPDPMIVYKATNPHTEAFGAVQALCPTEDPATQTQQLWLDELRAHVEAGGVILAFGEAINFCVAGTLIPLVEAGIPAESIILAYDASSPIPIFEERTRAVLTQARDLGVRFAHVSNLTVEGGERMLSTGQPELNYALPHGHAHE